MASNQSNPDAIQPDSPLQQYKREVLRTAGLPEYEMDDPARPFTEEYDESLRDSGPLGDTQSDLAAHDLEVDAASRPSPSKETLVARVDRLAEAAKKTGEKAVRANDPYEDLGGGIRTYREEGKLELGRRQDIIQTTAHGRGGQLVTRLTLNGKFLDIPQRESVPHAPEIEKAKDLLVSGHGASVSRLSKKSN